MARDQHRFVATIKDGHGPDAPVARRFEASHWIVQGGSVTLTGQGAGLDGSDRLVLRVEDPSQVVAGSEGCVLRIGRGMHPHEGHVLVVAPAGAED